ncbi:MAG: type II toxin-antitoxin system VapC family toxin [Dehalococcoidia bacterium]
MRTVLDASALLALLNSEVGGDSVMEVLAEAVISSVNHSEVIAKLAEGGLPEFAIHQTLDALALEVLPFDVNQSYLAGMLRVDTRSAGLSLGDRACLALAHSLQLPVLTTDRSWSRMNLGIEVQVIR